MTEIMHDIIIPDRQPGLQFYHKGVEYAVWLWLEDQTTDPYQLNLSQVVPVKGGYGVNNVVASSAWTKTIIEAGGVLKFMKDVFIPKANEYLYKQAGEDPTESKPVLIFPEDGSTTEQINWVIENALIYKDGKLDINI